MSHRKQTSQYKIDTIIALYKRGDRSLSEIVQITGVSFCTVTKYLDEAGLRPRERHSEHSSVKQMQNRRLRYG